MSLGLLSLVANHLWQSTVVAAIAAAIVLILRRNRAQTRYWLWFAASMKFLIPFSLLIEAGSRVEWRGGPTMTPGVASTVQSVGQPFTSPPTRQAVLTAARNTQPPATIPTVLLCIWASGAIAVLFTWYRRWRRLQAAARDAVPINLPGPVTVKIARSAIEPGIFGVFRPVLLLPEGIDRRLTPEQLRAILAHEFCHVRRKDNLASALHMLAEAVFWFHPLVWWIGARLVEERERACDEEVLRAGNQPQVYAEGILNVCRFYLESPLVCAAGVTGADLKKRVEEIMTRRVRTNLNFARKALLAAAGLATVAGPIGLGILSAPRGRALAADSGLTFEVASIKPADPNEQRVSLQLVPGGGMNVTNFPLKELIGFAYDVREFQVTGGPDWMSTARYNILAKAPASENAPSPGNMTLEQRQRFQDQVRERLRALLADRFQLAVTRDTKELPVYALVVGKDGPKLKESEGSSSRMGMGIGRGSLTANGATLEMLARSLARTLGRAVVDRTGLKGNYDFQLEWTPDPGGPGGPGGPVGPGPGPGGGPAPAPGGPSIFTAVQEQLGLKLDSSRGPVEMIVITRIEKPSEN